MRFIRYCIIGVFNTILDFGIYIGLTRGFEFWQKHYLAANALTFITVVTWSYFWNKYWAFRDRSGGHGKQYIKFVMATLVGIGIAESVLYSGVRWMHLIDLWAKVIAGPLVVLWNFSAYRFWAFGQGKDSIDETS